MRSMKANGRLRVSGLGALGIMLLLTPAPAEAPVADAAMTGDGEAVRSLLKSGADVNAAQGDGMTALHWAAAHDDAPMAEMLVYAGANLEATTRVGAYTPLLVASKAGSTAVIHALLEAGSDANARTTTGVTALHLAAAADDDSSIEQLLAHGADADVRDFSRGQTPLMFAAARNRVRAIRVLIEAGADPGVTSLVLDVPDREKADREDGRRRNELMKAMRDGAQELKGPVQEEPPTAPEGGEGAEESEEAEDTAADGAKPGEADTSEGAAVEDEEVAATEARDEDEEEAGTEAGDESEDEAEAEAGDESEDEAEADDDEPKPLTYGDLVGGHGGLTALLHAARQGNTEAVLALLDAGADINQVSAGDQTSPLLIATINGHFDLANVLLQKGADHGFASDAGATPLYAAINVHWAPKALYPQPKAHEQQELTYLDFMQILLDAGADPNVRLTKHLWYMSYNFDLLGVDTKGATTFWRAAYATDVDAMKLLVAHGADPNIPTMKVAERRRRDDGGKSKDEGDPSRLTPIPVGGPGVYPIHAASGVGYGKDFAANSHRHTPDGWVPAVRYLVEELGADVNRRDHEGYNAIHHAASRGDVELIEYLVEMGGDVKAVSRKGQTTADMANGPVQRVQPFPEAMELLESLGSENNHNCLSC